ncbi:hypothetical protein EJB05_00004, partial [Eragrostis curvula]
MDLPSLLPDDVLADVLRRLAPRWLAACRSVCTAWRDAVDARGLLLRADLDLLPLKLAGILINFGGLSITDFFSRPSTDPSISGKHNDYLPEASGERSWSYVVDHCNGLFLLPNGWNQSEWPPSLYVLDVYSSLTGQWEKRSFVREGEAAGTIGDMRLSLSDDKYRIVERPVDTKVSTFIYLGKSALGVYGACFYQRFRLRVWLLSEMCDQMEWVLKHEVDLYEWLLKLQLSNQLPEGWYHFELRPRGPWTLQDLHHYHYYPSDEEDNAETPTEDEVEWNSDASDDKELQRRSDNDHSVLGTYYNDTVKILGFHPFKEIVFLHESKRRGLAYHWRISKFEDLGNLYPTSWCWVDINNQNIESSFPYTPCWI